MSISEIETLKVMLQTEKNQVWVAGSVAIDALIYSRTIDKAYKEKWSESDLDLYMTKKVADNLHAPLTFLGMEPKGDGYGDRTDTSPIDSVLTNGIIDVIIIKEGVTIFDVLKSFDNDLGQVAYSFDKAETLLQAKKSVKALKNKTFTFDANEFNTHNSIRFRAFKYAEIFENFNVVIKSKMRNIK